MNKETWDNIRQQHKAMEGYTPDNFFCESDRDAGIPQPPLGFSRGGKVYALSKDFTALKEDYEKRTDSAVPSVFDALENRKSRRKYTDEPLSLLELSYLLYYTQGVKKMVGVGNHASFRTVPSAGSTHPLELYFFANSVEGIPAGLYHYISYNHTIELLREDDGTQKEELTKIMLGMKFSSNAPVLFVWTANPYRVEWRYRAHGPKYCLIDAGHSCENLYLAAEGIRCGCCGLGAYVQEGMDAYLELNKPKYSTDEEAFRNAQAPSTEERAPEKNAKQEAYEDAAAAEDRSREFAIYCASVGHVNR